MVRHQVRSTWVENIRNTERTLQLRKNRIMFGNGSRIGTGSVTRSRSGSVVATVNNQVNHANTYRGIILRISEFLSITQSQG
jgi:hypothetical protein